MQNSTDIGDAIHAFATELWGINRSITGEGVRETLAKIKDHIPDLCIQSVPSGTIVFDWTIPKEWNVQDAYIITPSGKKICEFRKNNLHVVGYSAPIHKHLPLKELQKHLYSLPDQPKAIPYITSYYNERWGFCISHEEMLNLEDGEYEVVLDSELFIGELNYGEVIIKGATDQEVFLSTYICHPSMANNELSGPTVLTYLVKWLAQLPNLKYTYRIVFIPETIGSITYLSKNYQEMKEKIVAGFNVSCVGDDRTYSYLPSRRGNTLSDKVAKHTLRWIFSEFVEYTWKDRGSDERQYCAPGIDLPIASIMRTKYGAYPEYHTSLDDLDNVVTPSGLKGGYEALRRAIELIERNETLMVSVLCEPQMGKRGLYPTLSIKKTNVQVQIMMELISWCDGEHSLLEIADKLNVPAWELYDLVDKLKSFGIID